MCIRDRQYIGPLPLQALTGNPVMHGTFAEKEQDTYSHLTLSDDAAAMVVAPCSAQTLARLAYGFADDVLAATALALQAPLLVAPAMNTDVYKRQPCECQNGYRSGGVYRRTKTD